MVEFSTKNNVVQAAQQITTIGPQYPITSSTQYDTCSERMTAYGGLLSLVKFLDLLGFDELFRSNFRTPHRGTAYGYCPMVKGLLMLLFIGFQRLGHFTYIQGDSMVCGILNVAKLPAISTFWRFLQSLGLRQSLSIWRLGAALRSRVWQVCGLQYKRISVFIDTTVSTVYGDIEHSHKGHNTKHRGKKGLRPVLAFIEQTREYLIGWQRPGKTANGKEIAKLICEMGFALPACVSEVLVMADAEFISWDSIEACLLKGYDYIFSVKRCAVQWKNAKWYRHGDYEYNEATYQPQGWLKPCRFVTMRIPEEKRGSRQLEIFDEDSYMYRTFATSLVLKPHNVIGRYDRRAKTENNIKEAQQEGLLAIPSKKFKSNSAFFQLVMLGYNLWRWMKLVAGQRYDNNDNHDKCSESKGSSQVPIEDNTIRIARLKLLFIAAKIIRHSGQTRVRYSEHDSRSANLLDFLEYLDRKRSENIRWRDDACASKDKIAA